MNKRIYLSAPHMSGKEQEYVRDVFESNWIAPLGPHVDAFEREFARTVGVEHAAAVSSGTAALHLALLLAGVKSGDEVLVSTFTFIASVNPILYQGAIPVFIDSERVSWNMDPNLVWDTLKKKAASGKLPKALILVHLYGQCADVEPIREACQRYGVHLIEDAAEALGGEYKGKAAGTLGAWGAYSFNGNKIITTSGGGMLVSDDGGLIEQARKLAAQAKEPTPHYEHTEVGYNYRLSNVLSAVGCAQLEVLAQRVEARRRVFEYYREALQDLPGVGFMPEADWGKHTRWLTCITLDAERCGVDPTQVRLALEEQNIESRPLWKPMHLQPVFAGLESVSGVVAEHLFERGLCLPSGSDLTTRDQDRVIAEIRRLACRGTVV